MRFRRGNLIRLAPGERFRRRRNVRRRAARPADRDGSAVGERRSEHLAERGRVAWLEYGYVRQTPQHGDVEHPVVRAPVRTHAARPVDGEHHRQVHDAHVVHDLVERALEESRVDGDHRLLTGLREAGRERDGA